MSFTIEHKIFDTICERIRQHMVHGAFIAINEGDSISLYDRLSVSGSFAGSYPRSFELKIESEGVCNVKEVTLFADLGTDAPTSFEDDVSFSSGVPFEIDNTGISATITGGLVGDEWLVRLGNAAVSIPSVYEHPVNYEALDAPSIGVYASGDVAQANMVYYMQSTMDIDLALVVPREMVEDATHLEILGDIRDCINRDSHLWDNVMCLADDIQYRGSTYFDQTDRGNSIFVINCQVTYRSNIKNSRSK